MFPEIFPKARIAEMNEEATPLNTKKITKLGLVVILELNFYFLILLVLLQYNYNNIKVHIYMYMYSRFICNLFTIIWQAQIIIILIIIIIIAEGLAQCLRSLPPNPEVHSSIPGLVEG